jgi:hypothetical protein
MRRPILTAGALLLLASSVLADLKIVGEMKLPANRLVRLEAEGAAEGAALIWDVSNEESVDAEEVGQRFLFAAPPGSYKIKLRSIRLKDGKTTVETARAVVVIGDTPPAPPVPPGPGPGPAPVPPPDPPSPAPIPAAGLRVLIVEESAERTKLPASQQMVILGKQVRDYLNAKCVVGPDGKTREWRIWDKDTDTSGVEKLWQDVMKRPRAQVPWIVISTGTTGYEGPLPATPEEALKLLRKYGGE